MQTATSQAPVTPDSPRAARAEASSAGGRFEVRRALRAMRVLLRDPNATDQVFVILEALGGRMLERTTKSMRRDAVGRRLLARPPALLPLLLDRPTLAEYGPGTLAHAYLEFVESEGITADGLVAADVRAVVSRSDVAFVQSWLRDTHDLKHALTGYSGDLIGEAALLSFDLAQHPSAGLALIVLAGYVRFGAISADLEPNARRIVRQAFMRGLRARTLIHVDFPEVLGGDLEQLRAELRLGPPPRYRPVRPHEVALS